VRMTEFTGLVNFETLSIADMNIVFCLII